MRNMMKEYLGNDYSDNHLKNFCLYWMKGRGTKPAWENTNMIEFALQMQINQRIKLLEALRSS